MREVWDFTAEAIIFVEGTVYPFRDLPKVANHYLTLNHTVIICFLSVSFLFF